MNQITVHFHTEQERVDPAFFDNLERLAQQYGLQVEENTATKDSASIVREGRDWLDRRDKQRAAQSKGARHDFSHLDRMRG